MKTMVRTLIAGAFYVAMFGHTASALDFEVVGTGGNQIPVAIIPFAKENTYTQLITPVVKADLNRSGLFKIVDFSPAQIPTDISQLPFDELNKRGVAVVAMGVVEPQANGVAAVKYRLIDVAKREQLDGIVLNQSATQLRRVAHKVSDRIYEKLTGDKGVFSTKIAYVLKQGKRFFLQVADADGYNPQSVVSSSEPIISPTWSADGGQIAYVSFEAKKPVVYVQSLSSGSRKAVANFKGSNSSPAFSADGSRLAVVLTQDGRSQIYSIPAQGGAARRLTQSIGIDTEPTFAPDGSIYFTSDRGGSPQIYRMGGEGGSASRVTFEGSYNVSPDVSPDGKNLAFIQNSGGRFKVAIMDFASKQVQVLTDTSHDESPSFAPNGKLILYATSQGGRGVLAAVSSDGRVKQKLTELSGDVREPAWGPFTGK
ncbi:Tol-Pal system beta propeller repeat protein TolB [Leeia sp. TBRC 13508]|uniref:Tol-Pal system protein TolB n=1 Tax=Leeia speluncae TaxID=2884804 RepID=A0ABS8D753_9NEIS|nr:Tol-Pal system beta propeller repeat protein TolB [Leeia speluncae]MCB6183868.1 Tol-Pal system beta propeller repeat protein TolB [Leeia speluncae]